jgi:hypothetical protein
MTAAKVTTGSETKKVAGGKGAGRKFGWRWVFVIAGLVVILSAALVWKFVTTPPATTEPPEAAKVLAAQANLKNFGILIPAYLPKGFNRADVQIDVTQNGPAGEPAAEMVYRTSKGASLFVAQWVPANSGLETLNGSRIIETKWGKSYLLTHSTEGLIAVWVDIGALRVSLSTADRSVVSREQLVLAAETLGLASNLQAYSFITEVPTIKDMAPPPPFDVKTNEQGIQELNLTITPGGYSPMRFSVKKDIPVKLVFRASGQVGCGNTMMFPADPKSPTALSLASKTDVKALEFTPKLSGDFQFECTNNCYRGIMTVKESGLK